jgi:hypothetical protein
VLSRLETVLSAGSRAHNSNRLAASAALTGLLLAISSLADDRALAPRSTRLVRRRPVPASDPRVRVACRRAWGRSICSFQRGCSRRSLRQRGVPSGSPLRLRHVPASRDQGDSQPIVRAADLDCSGDRGGTNTVRGTPPRDSLPGRPAAASPPGLSQRRLRPAPCQIVGVQRPPGAPSRDSVLQDASPAPPRARLLNCRATDLLRHTWSLWLPALGAPRSVHSGRSDGFSHQVKINDSNE